MTSGTLTVLLAGLGPVGREAAPEGASDPWRPITGAAELAGRVRFAQMNVDENPSTSARFGVRSIPTLLVFKGGQEVDRIVGVQPKAAIAARLERHAAPPAAARS